MIDPNDMREILFNISKSIIIPSFGNLTKKQKPSFAEAMLGSIYLQ